MFKSRSVVIDILQAQSNIGRQVQSVALTANKLCGAGRGDHCGIVGREVSGRKVNG
jgi:hypothetical protein